MQEREKIKGLERGGPWLTLMNRSAAGSVPLGWVGIVSLSHDGKAASRDRCTAVKI
jgi:hypothetical protein